MTQKEKSKFRESVKWDRFKKAEQNGLDYISGMKLPKGANLHCKDKKLERLKGVLEKMEKYDELKQMNEVCMNSYQRAAHEFADYPSGTVGRDKHVVDYLYPSLGLAEEAGEVAGKFAKSIRDNQGVIDEDRKKEIVKELGDVMWFVSELCTILDVSLSDVMNNNIVKLTSRRERNVIHGSSDNR